MTIKELSKLKIFKDTYNASLTVMRDIASRLPQSERDAIERPLLRAVKLIPMLIASGMAQKKNNERPTNLVKAVERCNEAIVALSYCRDLHPQKINGYLCKDLIDLYESSVRMLEASVGTDSVARIVKGGGNENWN